MFEHILVAYDGSESSDRALEAGARLAKGLGSKLAVLHNTLEGPVPERIAQFAPRSKSARESHSLGGFYEAASLHRDELEAIGVKLLEKARSAAESYGVGNVETVSTSGNAARSILEHAHERGVDTIVVGSRGHGPLTELLVGSVAHKLQNAFSGCVVTIR